MRSIRDAENMIGLGVIIANPHITLMQHVGKYIGNQKIGNHKDKQLAKVNRLFQRRINLHQARVS